MSRPASYLQQPCVTPSPLKNNVAIASASAESSVARGNVIWDAGWNQDMDTYPVHPAQRDVQVAFYIPPTTGRTVHDTLYILQAALRPILSDMGDKQPTSVAPTLSDDEAATIAFTVSTPKGPTRNKDKHCPICAASLGRLQDRKRHILSHLPHWLQCQVPGCSWRGDRWEHLRKHRLKAHPSSCQESDSCESIIYD